MDGTLRDARIRQALEAIRELQADLLDTTALAQAAQATAGAAVPGATFAAKGDILAGTAAGAFARLSAGANGQVLTADSSQGTGLKYAAPATGSVTSVDISVPAALLTASGGPVTTTGTLALALAVQAAAQAFIGPASGGAVAPTFRALVATDTPAVVPNSTFAAKGDLVIGTGASTYARHVVGADGTLPFADSTQTDGWKMRVAAAADIPSLDASKIATGQIPVARGGTNSGAALGNNLVMASSGGAIVELAAAGTANQVLTSNGAGALPTWQTVSGVSGGWTTYYTLDITAQATLNWITGGDGNKTLDGKTWRAYGTANATVFGVTNGVGLVITAKTASRLMASINLTNLVTGFNPRRDDIEVWARITATGSILNSFAASGFTRNDTNPTLVNTQLSWSLLQGQRNNAGGANFDTWINIGQLNSTNYGSLTNSTNNLTDDMRVDRMVSYAHSEHSSGVWAGSFPALTTLRNRGDALITTPSQTTAAMLNSDVAWFAMVTDGGTPSVTITHIQVRIRQ